MLCRQCSATLSADAAFCDSCGAKVLPPDPFLGRALHNKYVVRRKIGEGGFGAVYEAEEAQFGRKVAIKTLHKHLTQNPKIVERFRREGFAASSLTHPYAVKMHDMGETEDGILWMAMEFLPGEPLDAYLQRKGSISLKELVGILGPICEVLGEAHEKGIVHRDLKPQNIMLVPVAGKILPKILDFGISKLLEADTLTQSGMMMGTPAYMPPEQWDGAKYSTPASDIYALGMIAYQALSGRYPFEADTPAAWMKKHCFADPLDLEQAMEGRAISPEVEAVIMRALAKDPKQRYQTTLSFKEALEQAYEESRPARSTSGGPGAVATPALVSSGELATPATRSSGDFSEASVPRTAGEIGGNATPAPRSSGEIAPAALVTPAGAALPSAASSLPAPLTAPPIVPPITAPPSSASPLAPPESATPAVAPPLPSEANEPRDPTAAHVEEAGATSRGEGDRRGEGPPRRRALGAGAALLGVGALALWLLLPRAQTRESPKTPTTEGTRIQETSLPSTLAASSSLPEELPETSPSTQPEPPRKDISETLEECRALYKEGKLDGSAMKACVAACRTGQAPLDEKAKDTCGKVEKAIAAAVARVEKALARGDAIGLVTAKKELDRLASYLGEKAPEVQKLRRVYEEAKKKLEPPPTDPPIDPPPTDPPIDPPPTDPPIVDPPAGPPGKADLGAVPDLSQARDETGILLAGARPGSPAAQAGLRAGDVILSINGRSMEGPGDLAIFLKKSSPGEVAEIVFLRGTEERRVSVTLGEAKKK